MNNKQHTYNTDLAWKKLHSRFKEDNLLESKKKNFNSPNILKIAAIFILTLMVSGVFYYYLPSNENSVKLSLFETKSIDGFKEIKLTDGSIIYLSSNSKLYYPEEFEGNERKIEFEGEGFFDIAKNPTKPFIIKAGNTEIKVLGTSFNVNTKFKENKLEVFVKTGKVQVSKLANKKNKVFLEAGQLALVENTKISKKTNTNKNYISWKTKHFDFRNVEMQQVIEHLNKAYNVHIIIENNAILKRKLRTKFEDTPLDTILKVIAEPYNLEVEKNDKYIIFR